MDNMKIKNINNQELIFRYTKACFLITNYPNNKKYNKEWNTLYTVLCDRLNVDKDEMDKMKL